MHRTDAGSLHEMHRLAVGTAACTNILSYVRMLRGSHKDHITYCNTIENASGTTVRPAGMRAVVLVFEMKV